MSLVVSTAPSGSGPLQVVAALPSGEQTLLLELRRPNPLWLGRYDLVEPLRLPSGTVLRSGDARVWASWTTPPDARGP